MSQTESIRVKLSRFEPILDFYLGFQSDILMMDERKGTEIPIPFVFLLQKNDTDGKASACDESHRSGAFFVPETWRRPWRAGRIAGQWILKNLQIGLRMSLVSGSMTMESQNNWADAAVARQEEAYPKMELVADKRVADDSDAEKAYELTKQLLQKYPNLKGILGTGSFDAPGAARAIQELGLQGKVFAISVAMPSEVKDYLADGTLQSVGLWDPAISAKVMLNAGVDMFNGKKIEEGMDLQEKGYEAVKLNDKVSVGDGAIAITNDNVDDFGF